MKFHRYIALLLMAVLIAGCASRGYRAPIVERGDAARATGQHERDWRPKVYVVQKGDTLYSIAFNYGFDYHELAELNHIEDPTLISIGQEIHLFPGRSSSASVAEVKPVETLLKEQPKVVKYAYSEAAMAQIEKVQEQKYGPPMVATAESKPETKSEAKAAPDQVDEADETGLGWIIPAQGKLIAEFSETANRKGIDISGTLGQPVYASASGKVVYSGNGLRGYGKLVIIKHNKTYLSAYAHNDKVLVKEGESVIRGQKIAAMGKTDTDQVKLHFEVRRFGKPVDPAKYLPLGNS
ncbi:MAG: peptidoglycan DD-metalloendopeptidase family protein [Pseudomonadota bacterium]